MATSLGDVTMIALWGPLSQVRVGRQGGRGPRVMRRSRQHCSTAVGCQQAQQTWGWLAWLAALAVERPYEVSRGRRLRIIPIPLETR
jgi:hypothetical protein